jgi:hypothetical protein
VSSNDPGAPDDYDGASTAKEFIMRASRFCVVCLTGAIVAVCAYLYAAEGQTAAAKAPDMQQRVATLEEKVALLERKLNQAPTSYLPTVPPAVAPRAGSPIVPVTPQLPPGVPPNATPREFNGQTYYIVPLSKEAQH